MSLTSLLRAGREQPREEFAALLAPLVRQHDLAVQNALVALRPIMDEARRGSTEDADAAAVDVVAAIMQTRLT